MELSPFCIHYVVQAGPGFFTLSFDVFIPFLRNISISSPLKFLVLIRVACFPDSLDQNLPLVLLFLALYTFARVRLSLRTSSVYILHYASTREAYKWFLRIHISLPAPLVPISICFRRILCVWSLLRQTRILWLGTLLLPPPYSFYPVPSSFSLYMRTLQLCIKFPPLFLLRLLRSRYI